MMYLSEAGDTLFDTRNVGTSVQIMVDTIQWKGTGLLYEVLELLEVGDSVTFQIPARNLFEVSFQSAVPNEIPSSSNIKFFVGLEKSKNQQQ